MNPKLRKLIAPFAAAVTVLLVVIAVVFLKRADRPNTVTLNGIPERTTTADPSPSPTVTPTTPPTSVLTTASVPPTTTALPKPDGEAPINPTAASDTVTVAQPVVPPPQGPKTYPETGGHRTGSPTFADTKAATPGPRNVNFGEVVQVSCKVFDPSIPTASPDGYWYRLASPPWNDAYYAVANTFTNGDVLGDPNGTRYTDTAVRDC